MLTSQKLNTPGGFPVLTVVIIPVLELPIAFEVFRHQVLPFTVKIGAIAAMPSSDCKHPASVRAACGRKFISRGVRLGEGKVPDAAGLAVQGEEKAKLCVRFWRRLLSAP